MTDGHHHRPVHLAGGKPASDEDFLLERRFRLMDELLPRRGGTLLDFGCGTGAQTRWFGERHDRLIGCDVSPDFLRGFTRRMAAAGLAEKSLAVRYDGRRLPVADAGIDVVVSFEVLEHVEDEPKALEEIVRVLRPGGWLGLSVPNRWWVFETHGADLPLLPWNRVPFFSWLPTPLHDRWARARIYRRRQIVAKVEEVGLRVERSGYITAPMDVVRNPSLKRALRGTIFSGDTTPVPMLATAVYVVAQKPPA